MHKVTTSRLFVMKFVLEIQIKSIFYLKKKWKLNNELPIYSIYDWSKYVRFKTKFSVIEFWIIYYGRL